MRQFHLVRMVRDSLRDNQIRPVSDWGSSDEAGDPPAIRRLEKISEHNSGSSIATRERASRQDA